jgi:ornithine carbamoyltransferase
MIGHFLRDDDLSSREQAEILDPADAFRKDRFHHQPLAGPQAVAVLFAKPSTRTRAPSSVGIAELRWYPPVMDASSSQLGRGEPVEDVVATGTWVSTGPGEGS